METKNEDNSAHDYVRINKSADSIDVWFENEHDKPLPLVKTCAKSMKTHI